MLLLFSGSRHPRQAPVTTRRPSPTQRWFWTDLTVLGGEHIDSSSEEEEEGDTDAVLSAVDKLLEKGSTKSLAAPSTSAAVHVAGAGNGTPDVHAAAAAAASQAGGWNKAEPAKKRKRKNKKKNADGNAAKKKDKKLSFEQMTEKGWIILEVRCADPEQKLDQQDYDVIEVKVVENYMITYRALKQAKKTVWHYKEMKSGICQKGLWFALGNKESADFLYNLIPAIQPPEGRAYTYFSYKPDERPFRYVRTYIPEKYYGVRKTIPESLKAFNEEFEAVIDDDGYPEESHITISKVKEPEERKITDDDGNVIKIIKTFFVELEIDYKLITPLVKAEGILKLGHSSLVFTGASLETLIKAEKQKATIQPTDG